MASLIPEVKRGAAPSLLDADLANKLIRAINALSTMKVTPEGYGKFTTDGQSGATLDLGALQKIIQGLAQQITAIQNSINTSGVQAVSDRLDALIGSINSATISATCNDTGTITVTITFPDVPVKAGG